MLTQVPDPGGPGAGAVNGGRCAWGGRGGECRPKSQLERGPQSVQSVQGEQALRIGRGMASGGIYRPKGRGFGVARRTGTPAPRHHRRNRHPKRTNKCLHKCQSPAGRGAAGVGGGVAAAPLPTSPDRAGAAVGASSRPCRARRKAARGEKRCGAIKGQRGVWLRPGVWLQRGVLQAGAAGHSCQRWKGEGAGGHAKCTGGNARAGWHAGCLGASQIDRECSFVRACVRACMAACVSDTE